MLINSQSNKTFKQSLKKKNLTLKQLSLTKRALLPLVLLKTWRGNRIVRKFVEEKRNFEDPKPTPFHLVSPSYIPILTALGVSGLLVHVVHRFYKNWEIPRWPKFNYVQNVLHDNELIFNENAIQSMNGHIPCETTMWCLFEHIIPTIYFFLPILTAYTIVLLLYGPIEWFIIIVQESYPERNFTPLSKLLYLQLWSIKTLTQFGAGAMYILKVPNNQRVAFNEYSFPFQSNKIYNAFKINHTWKSRQGLRLGMIFFIISEIMFFFSFFWAFFHSSVAPEILTGAVWPMRGIEALSPWALPLINTLILLSSGVTITLAHHGILNRQNNNVCYGLALTIILGIIFTICQLYEYQHASITIADGIFGSLFFVATGFHGTHVIIGTTFLCVCMSRALNHRFTKTVHIGFEAAAWYWHSVDVVWIFLYTFIHLWGGAVLS